MPMDLNGLFASSSFLSVSFQSTAAAHRFNGYPVFEKYFARILCRWLGPPNGISHGFP